MLQASKVKRKYQAFVSAKAQEDKKIPTRTKELPFKVRFNIESQRQADKQQKESSNEKNKNDAPAVAKNVKTGTSKAAVSRVSHEIMWTIL